MNLPVMLKDPEVALRDDQRFHRKVGDGEGLLRVARSGKGSTVVRSSARSPMRLFVQRKKAIVPYVYTSSYGGGLLAGDQTDLVVQLERGSRCVISSQASTKIYKNPRGLPCSQTMHVDIAHDAMLALAPEPISLFAESQYDQNQHFDIAEGGSLVLVDWVTSGRYAIGERFQFKQYESRQSIHYNRKHLIEDAVRLCPADGPLDNKFRMGQYNCAALMIILGEPFRALAGRLLHTEREQSLQRSDDLVSIIQPLPHDVPGVLIRVLSVETQDAKHYFDNHFRHLDPIIGAQTWAGKL